MAEFKRVAAANEIAAGQSKVFEVDGNSIAVCNVNGNFFAVQNMCPHRGGPVGEGEIEDLTITCPWHGFRFDLKTGACAFNPAMKLTTYDVKVEGSDIHVLL